MTFLPVVERELRVAARKKGTYWNRFGAALVAIVFCVWVLLTTTAATPDRIGVGLFRSVVMMLYFYVAIAGAYATSDSLTTEKRDGTLGLLFLTDLKAYDVILGKLTSNSLAIVYRVLSVFPILAVSFLLGGVSNGEMSRTILVTFNLLMLSLAIGIFASAASRNGWGAIRLAMIILVILLVTMPALVTLMNLGRAGLLSNALLTCWLACGCVTAIDSEYRNAQTVFWVHAGLMQLLSWTFLLLACRLVPRCWQDRPMTAEPGWWKRITRWFALRPNAQKRAEMLEQNPYFWRAWQRQTARLQAWSVMVVGALVWAVAISNGGRTSVITVYLLLFVHLVIKLVAAGEAARAVADDRHSGAMELLLTTPLSPDQIVRGHGRALFNILVAPVAVLIAIDTIALIAGLQLVSGNPAYEFVSVYFVAIGCLVLDIVAARWTALWLGLTQRSALRATAGTVFRILLLPVLIFALVITCTEAAHIRSTFGRVVSIWAMLSVICDVYFIARAQACLRGRFRSVAAGE